MTAKSTIRRALALSALLTGVLFAWGSAPAFAALPTVTSYAATGITGTSATLNGKVTTDSTLTNCHFDYVQISDYRLTGFAGATSVNCAQALGSIPLNTATAVTAAVARPAGETLVYRLAATNATGPQAALDNSVGFGLTSLTGGVFDSLGANATHAGSTPVTAAAEFVLSGALAVDILSSFKPTGTLRNTTTDVPVGLVGNPQALPACPTAVANTTGCPVNTQVGYAIVNPLPESRSTSVTVKDEYVQVFNMEPPKGYPAMFRFNVAGAPTAVVARLRSDGDYGVSLDTVNAPETASINGVKVVLWGVPADPANDADRGFVGGSGLACANPSQPPSCASSSNAPLVPFLRLPTSCVGDVTTTMRIETWEGDSDSASFTSPGGDSCNALDFSPTLQARPTTNVADSPSGLDVDLHVPQSNTCVVASPVASCGTAEAHLKDTVVTLPEGLVLNPSSANGLDGCSLSEFGLTSAIGAQPIATTADPATCPDASKVATVQIDTPLLDHPVEGAAYIAQPHDNPFGSLLALYIALDDPISGTVVKLAGEVRPDPVTGQLTATFENNPQLPFEHFRLHFKGGSHAALRTPPTCGTYQTTSSLTPWSAPDSGPPATPADTWAIEQGPGGSCASDQGQLPNTPSFDAGTVTPVAGARTPLVVNLRRNDGTQQFSSLTLTPPQGLVGKLAGIPYCPQSALDEAAAKSGRQEEASPSCPQASYVGGVTAAAGAGPAPYYAPGRAYLTGPYKGAPLSIAILTPATAGPFDLGTIVVRTALYVDRTTAQITAVSDPIPSILQGIPLDVRSVQVRMDRPDFTLNPTSCDPSTFGGQLMSTLGQAAPLQSRFQVGECGRLGFKPKLTLALKGGTRRTGHPALTATMTMPEGGANLAAISVALPHSEFLDQSHIGTVCTRVQFRADQCPPESIYGSVVVNTPLLDYPLTGNVYLRSSDNPLPDLVPDLRGPAFQPIALEADGRVDSVKGGIRNTFDFVPDAAFSKLTLSMQGGRKGLLENSTNLCARVQRATVSYTAHNGATLTARPALKVKCPKAKKKGRKDGRAKAKAGTGHRRGR